jgi:hypothetical protein
VSSEAPRGPWTFESELVISDDDDSTRPPHHLEAPDSGLADNLHLHFPMLLASLNPLLLPWMTVLWFTSSKLLMNEYCQLVGGSYKECS